VTTSVENQPRTPTRTAGTALLWSLRLALAAVFAGAGLVTLAGDPAMVDDSPALPLALLLLTAGVAWVRRGQLP